MAAVEIRDRHKRYPLDRNVVWHGHCMKVMRRLPENSVDACVTDPPYHLTAMTKRFGKDGAAPAKGPAYQRHNAGFMGKTWDGGDIAFDPATWAEVYRVLKPGAHLLAMGGTRTYHRLVCAIEDAGFEIRDTITWLYGSGFPKSLDVSKAIDKAAGVKRDVVDVVPARLPQAQARGWGNPGVDRFRDERRGTVDMALTVPASDKAKQWDGWGTALKPACELIVLARKPLSEKSVAANVLRWGTGGLNIDAARIGTDDNLNGGAYSETRKPSQSEWVAHGGTIHSSTGQKYEQPKGRWPANVVLDKKAGRLLDEQTGRSTSTQGKPRAGRKGDGWGMSATGAEYADSGGASRFFYCAKASRSERGYGNSHPTVKPLALIKYLIQLITPPDGVVLDPFLGSGTTALACIDLEFDYIGIEFKMEYVRIAQSRMDKTRVLRLSRP